MHFNEKDFSDTKSVPDHTAAGKCEKANRFGHLITRMREGKYSKIYSLYDELRELQKEVPSRLESGDTPKDIAVETWELFRSIE